MTKTKPFVVALTGASGIVYGIRLITALAERGEKVIVLISQNAETVIRAEYLKNFSLANKKKVLSSLFPQKILKKLEYYSFDDLLAPPASGSFFTKGMIVCPATQATISAIRIASSRNLIERAADVTVKEGRPLVLVPREMPLSALHLENMTALARIGVKIIPAAPGFYHQPKTINDLVDFVVGKILDAFEIEHDLFRRWGS